ncbi:GntR family transcriptional regulator [Pseudonocardia sediminis]|uniref:GntR family transcriptional regulator n=1 Tax=Pseudonocardia sediminis TaxID=1397368 RepID=UPI001A913658|nr:GntR family transcriptional regulator [Pseudonocardia sediminis]
MTALTTTWTASLAQQRGRIQVGSTAERVADLLRGQVLEGELRPGMQLAEEPLVEALAVSRNTVREALQKLSQERLVEHHRHRGVFVRRLGRDDLSDLCGLRRAVEVGAVRDAAAHAVDPELAAAVRAAAESGRRAADAGDWGAAGTANAQTHLALAALAGNTRVDETMRALVAEMRLAFLVVSDPRALHEPYVEANLALGEQVVSGRLTEAADELDAYLRRAERHLLDIYSAAIAADRA